jgi:hypothetical protein
MRLRAFSLALLVAVAALATGCLSWRDLPVESERSRCLRAGARWVEPPHSIPICEYQMPGFL